MLDESLMAKRYAEEHKRFLQEHRPDVWRRLQQDDPNSYLSSVGQQAAQRFMDLMSKHSNSPAVQKLPHLQRVQELQSRRHEVEELIQHELIFQPLPA